MQKELQIDANLMTFFLSVSKLMTIVFSLTKKSFLIIINE